MTRAANVHAECMGNEKSKEMKSKVKVIENTTRCDETVSRKDEVIAEMKRSRNEAQQLAMQKKRKTFTKKQILDLIR